jgi:hypothetical protein
MFKTIKNYFNLNKPVHSQAKPAEFVREISDGRVDYEFQNGLKCFQAETNLVQDTELIELFSLINMNDFASLANVDFKQLHELMKDKKVVHKFLSIVLVNAEPGIINETYFDSLKSSELEAIKNDFFGLNPTFREMLENLKAAVVSTAILKIAGQASGEKILKNTTTSSNR